MWLYLFLGLIIYVVIIQSVRFQRLKYIRTLDPEKDASKIFWLTSYVEFPFVVTKSLEFALFKTFGIPSISKILDSTKEFATDCNRRYDDTDLILREITEHGQANERGDIAIQRLNYLHGKYKISNDDFLYTLSLFVLEPIRWINKCEWRELSEVEKEVIYLTWREIGIKMGIKQIPESLEALEFWSRQYEKKFTKYSPSNARVADATVNLFLSIVPAFLRPLGRRIIPCLLEERLREALGYAPPPDWLVVLVNTTLKLRGFFVWMFMPPRSEANAVLRTPPQSMVNDGVRLYRTMFDPYRPSYPDGYVIERLGPKQFSKEEQLKPLGTKTEDSINTSLVCPFMRTE